MRERERERERERDREEGRQQTPQALAVGENVSKRDPLNWEKRPGG